MLAALLIGCGTDSGGTTLAPDASISSEALVLARDIQPILDMYCVRCHALGAADPHGNPHFTSDSSRRSLQKLSECTSGGAPVPLVVAGRPEESFLLYKLGAATNLTVAGMTCEQKMPYDAEAPLAELDPEAVARIRQWVLDGAH